MTPPPVCILYTQDPGLLRRVKAFARTTAQVRHVADADRLDAVLQQASPALLVMDLRAKECRDLIDQIQNDWPEVLIIALGTARSEPLRDAEQIGIYAAEDLEIDRRRFQALTARAFDYLKVLQDNRDLRETSTSPQVAKSSVRPETGPERYDAGPSSSLIRFPRLLRRFDNVDAAHKFFEDLAFTIERHRLTEVIGELVSPNRLGQSRQEVEALIGEAYVFVNANTPVNDSGR